MILQVITLMKVAIGEKNGYKHFSDSCEPPIPHMKSNIHAMFGNVSHDTVPDVGLFPLSTDKTKHKFCRFFWQW